MSKVDMELKKAFAELQQKALDTAEQLELEDNQIDRLKFAKQLAIVTQRDLATFPPNTTAYDSVGRMFILTSFEEIKRNWEARQNSAEEKIKTLENNKAFLEKSLKESKNNLREMVQQKKASI